MDTAPAAEALDTVAADIAAAECIEEQDNHTEDSGAAADTAAVDMAVDMAVGTAVDMAPAAGIAAVNIAADRAADTVVGDTGAAGTAEPYIEAADTAAGIAAAAGIAERAADTAAVDTVAVDKFFAASASWVMLAAAAAFRRRVFRLSAKAAGPGLVAGSRQALRSRIALARFAAEEHRQFADCPADQHKPARRLADTVLSCSAALAERQPFAGFPPSAGAPPFRM